MTTDEKIEKLLESCSNPSQLAAAEAVVALVDKTRTEVLALRKQNTSLRLRNINLEIAFETNRQVKMAMEAIPLTELEKSQLIG